MKLIFYGKDPDFVEFSEGLSKIFEKDPVYCLEKGPSLDGECPRVEIPEWRLSWNGMPGFRELGILANFFSSNFSINFENTLGMEAGLRFFIGKACPFCPGVLRKLLPMLCDKKISLEVFDAESCSEAAAAYAVRAVPTLMIAGDEKNFRWIGDISITDLKEALHGRKIHELGVESLRNILERGDAERLYEMMQEAGKIFPSFYPLLFHEKWSVRLGAMVVAESLVEEGGFLGERLLEEIWTKKDSLDPVVLGDMVYLMGSGKAQIWVPRLEKFFLKARDNELKSAIEEALQQLKGQERNQ